jgi:hypothetical protein
MVMMFLTFPFAMGRRYADLFLQPLTRVDLDALPWVVRSPLALLGLMLLLIGFAFGVCVGSLPLVLLLLILACVVL